MARLTPSTGVWNAPRPGLSREEAVAAVGPGWAELAGAAWDAVHAAGARVTTAKEKLGRLETYYAGLTWPSPEADALHARLAAITEASTRTCEACGVPGTTWDDASAPPLLSGLTRILTWRKSLCVPCAWRFYAESVRGWDRIAGRWRPDDAPGQADGEDDR